MASIVKKLRTAMGLSQEAFAHRIGRSFASVRMYETGRMPPLEVLAKMLAIARVTPGYDAIQRELEVLLGGMLHTADSAAKANSAAEAEQMEPGFRAGLHAMLDYVIDNGRGAAVSALCETIRLYFEELRHPSPSGVREESALAEYRVIAPVDLGDGVLHASGDVVRISIETARRNAYALIAMDDADDERRSNKKLA